MIIAFLYLSVFITIIRAHKCGTDQHLEHQLSQDLQLRERMDLIEQHTRQHTNYDGQQTHIHSPSKSLPSLIIIPINFLITKGPSDPYIGYRQLISQIRVLNLNYQGLNADKGQDGHGSTSEFSASVGDFNIRFSLNKIKRKTVNHNINFHEKLLDMKNESLGGQYNEDPEHALNIWVNVFDLNTTVMAFSSFPGYPGWEDGIVLQPDLVGSIEYDYYGDWTNALDRSDNLGITLVHEIGHWLNLYHPWMDKNAIGGCNHDDGVSDTPVADVANYNCKPVGKSSCGSHDMYMNFMDYSDDRCRNMFTQGQVDRSHSLFLKGGHREKLLDYESNPTDVLFVDYFYFIYGSVAKCDVGHTRRDLNLNAGADNVTYIYLCVSYSRNPHVDVITDLYILSGNSRTISCTSGYEKIDSDLNDGATDPNADYVYVCYKKESRKSSVPFITDLYPFGFTNEYKSSTYQGYTLAPGDLNAGLGGQYIYLGFRGPNYFKGPERLNYADAAAFCESQGTKLASIGTEQDWNHAKSVCTRDNSDCWIGLKHDGSAAKGIWAWEDGIDIAKSFGFNKDKTATTGQRPWESGEPNNIKPQNDFVITDFVGGRVDCGSMYRDGKYYDDACSELYYPLCNKEPIPKRYLRGPTELNYTDASKYCETVADETSYLASILTRSEWNDAKKACGDVQCWIGLSDVKREGIWVWQDGSRASNSYGLDAKGSATKGIAPWNVGEPNSFNSEEDYVMMYPEGGPWIPHNSLYNDVPGRYEHYPLCSITS